MRLLTRVYGIYLTVVYVSGAGDLTGQPGVTSPPALLEETPHRTQQEWSYLFGGEEQELQAMVEELLTAFPTLTTERESATSAASFPRAFPRAFQFLIACSMQNIVNSQKLDGRKVWG